MLPAEPQRARDTLYPAEVTVRSYLGAVIFPTGGILVDHGWLRILGSGDAARGLVDFATANPDPANTPGVLIAVDVLGGQFAWAPSEPAKPPTVHYFAPDSLEWEDSE